MLMRYVIDAIRAMVSNDIGSLECRRDVRDDYIAKVDAAHENMVWTHPGMSTYYRNEHG